VRSGGHRVTPVFFRFLTRNDGLAQDQPPSGPDDQSILGHCFMFPDRKGIREQQKRCQF
jgi:hypothetical protein